MTQSGQGEEPSARPAHEGIVLPSDGGEPLLPGMRSGAHDGGQQYGQQAPPASAPPGGQTWGQPWGPEQQQPGSAGQGWPLPTEQQGWHTPRPTGPDGWGSASRPGGAPLPPEGAPAPSSYGHGAPSAPLPPPADGGVTQYISPVPVTPVDDGATQYISPVPVTPVDDGATQYISPVPATPVNEGATQYIPPVTAAPVDEGATQYLPPVGPGALPPETPSESTHFLGSTAQRGPGPMPGAGARPAGSFPGAPSHPGAPAYPGDPSYPGAGGPLPGASHPDADATQYIPPVTGRTPYGGGDGERQPPAEFENLFRNGPAGDGPAASTQHLPRFAEPGAAAGHGGYGAGHGGPHGGGHGGHGAGTGGPARPSRAIRDDDDHGRGRGGRTGSRLPLFAAVGVGIAVVGIGAGALLAGGGGGDQGDDNKTVAASAPATEASPSASAADPAEQQAIALDKLLADSGSSRASVISAVADVKKCGNLAQAASDLRDAAKQRNELVTKLSGLSVDKLPNHAALTTALTKAWQASASADNHYAAWADQVAGDKKNCRKGQARTTAQTQAGNRASGTASAQKTQAAKLWNEIAKTYGLTQRQPTQL
ncbi:hypothetical protein ACIHAR_24010 [Streptomyces sp. NPDC052016]|uniref:hypothetical protein n=1 Tax=Streptomyces sp. NPDC052016 TaxID=3365680 RepID=UPI0037D3B02F